MSEQVILVDENDKEIGQMAKMEAHQKGVLHRAFSVFIFNTEGKMLLQQRAQGKYHSAGLWSNTCCSHPRPGEKNQDAAERRLYEEMGIKCPLTEIFSFIYKTQLENGLTEYEYDHVYIGTSNQIPHPDTTEVAAWAYKTQEELEPQIKAQPEKYTEWFKLCLKNRQDEIYIKK
jgi:isopentenyl-diphosphate delta-isomerase